MEGARAGLYGGIREPSMSKHHRNRLVIILMHSTKGRLLMLSNLFKLRSRNMIHTLCGSGLRTKKTDAKFLLQNTICC